LRSILTEGDRKVTKVSAILAVMLVVTGTGLRAEAAAWDLNDDGRPDVIFANYGAGNGDPSDSYVYYWDTGTLPIGGIVPPGAELGTVGAIDTQTADIDGDGYIDIVFANFNNNSFYDIDSYVYWGDAGGTYADRTDLPTQGAAHSTIADVNKDGYLDILFANYYSDGAGSSDIDSYIYWGDGTRGYSPADRTGLPTHSAFLVMAEDLNNDTHVDVVYGNYTGTNSYIYWGLGAKAFNPLPTELPTDGVFGGTMEDINKDGYLDIVFANSAGLVSTIYWGDPGGTYATSLDLATSGAYDAAVADLNDDGFRDIVFADASGDSYIYWGDGVAFLTMPTTPLATLAAVDVEVGDLNLDGYLDIVFANFNGDSRVYWGAEFDAYLTWTDFPTMSAQGVTIVPEPFTLGLLAVGVPFLLKRKRK